VEQGLAEQMVYGNGSNQTNNHYYAGVVKKRRTKKKVKVNKKNSCNQ
jgi:hypothetical protein